MAVDALVFVNVLHTFLHHILKVVGNRQYDHQEQYDIAPVDALLLLRGAKVLPNVVRWLFGSFETYRFSKYLQFGLLADHLGRLDVFVVFESDEGATDPGMVLLLLEHLDHVFCLEDSSRIVVLDGLASPLEKLDHPSIVENQVGAHDLDQVVVLEEAELVSHPFLELLASGRVRQILLVQDLIENVTLTWLDLEEESVVTRRHCVLVIALGEVLGPIGAQHGETNDDDRGNDLDVNALGSVGHLLVDFEFLLLAHVLNEEPRLLVGAGLASFALGVHKVLKVLELTRSLTAAIAVEHVLE